MSIQFTDVCYITENVMRLRAFYEAVFGGEAEGDRVHSGLALDGLAFTFDYVSALQETSAFDYVTSGGTNNVIVSFNVDDVDTEYQRLLSRPDVNSPKGPI